MRRDDEGAQAPSPSRSSPASASPVSVSTGAPSSLVRFTTRASNRSCRGEDNFDTLWTRQTPSLGVLVRYADDFVLMCDTQAACERAEQRVREILARLGLERHPDKTRRIDLSRGRGASTFPAVTSASAGRIYQCVPDG